jgi:hypothetical protein
MMARSTRGSKQGPDTDAQDQPLDVFAFGLRRAAVPCKGADKRHTGRGRSQAEPPEGGSQFEPVIVHHEAINAGLGFRRQALKPMLAKPGSRIIHAEGSPGS